MGRRATGPAGAGETDARVALDQGPHRRSNLTLTTSPRRRRLAPLRWAANVGERNSDHPRLLHGGGGLWAMSLRDESIRSASWGSSRGAGRHPNRGKLYPTARRRRRAGPTRTALGAGHSTFPLTAEDVMAPSKIVTPRTPLAPPLCRAIDIVAAAFAIALTLPLMTSNRLADRFGRSWSSLCSITPNPSERDAIRSLAISDPADGRWCSDRRTSGAPRGDVSPARRASPPRSSTFGTRVDSAHNRAG